MVLNNKTTASPPSIAIVLNAAWNIYNFRKGLVQAMVRKGFRVYCIAPPDEFVREIEEWGVYFIPLKHLNRKGKNIYSDFRLYHELKTIFQTYQIEIALLYTIKPNIFGTLAAKSCGIKTICTVTGLGYTFIQKGWINTLVKLLYHRAFRIADYILFQNRDDLQLFQQFKLGKVENMAIVPGSGIDTEYYQTVHPIKSNSKFDFIFVGRLLTDKGVRELRQAADLLYAKNPNFKLHLVGDLDHKNPATLTEIDLKDWKNQPYLIFHGKVMDIRPYLEASDVLVLPSYREGLPRVCLEAMSMAKPLIVTDVPGCRETVENKVNGYLCKVNDGIDLYKKMKAMTELSPDQRMEMGKQSRKIVVSRFDEQIVVQQYFNLIEDLLSSS